MPAHLPLVKEEATPFYLADCKARCQFRFFFRYQAALKEGFQLCNMGRFGCQGF